MRKASIGRIAAVLLLFGGVGIAADKSGKPIRYNIMTKNYYAREATDRVWHVRIVGEIPSLCGAYLLIHDTTGKVVYHGVIPHGKFTEAKPHVVAIPKDGVTGDYRMILVGNQRDALGILVPWTDLPLEVYGDSSFSLGHNKSARPVFKAPKGVTKMSLGAYKGQLKVRDAEDKVIADTMVDGKKGKGRQRNDNIIEFPVKPGAVYRLELHCFYFRSYIPHTCYLACTTERWFKPSSDLNNIKWWELIK